MSLPRPVSCPFCGNSRVAIDNRRISKKYGKAIVWRCWKCHKLWTTHEFESPPCRGLPRPSECPFCHDSRVEVNEHGFTRSFGRVIKWRCWKCHKQWTTHEFESLPKELKPQKYKIIKDRVHLERHIKDLSPAFCFPPEDQLHQKKHRIIKDRLHVERHIHRVFDSRIHDIYDLYLIQKGGRRE